MADFGPIDRLVHGAVASHEMEEACHLLVLRPVPCFQCEVQVAVLFGVIRFDTIEYAFPNEVEVRLFLLFPILLHE